MKTIKKRISILTLVFMLFTSIIAPNSALSAPISASTNTNQQIVLYYPNGDWGLTPVEKTISVSKKDNIYLLALQQLAHPTDTLPVGVHGNEFPASFNVEDVKIVKDTAYVTVSETAFNDPGLLENWLKTLENIICYNMFELNPEIDSVEFLSSASTSTNKNMTKITKNDLFSAPSLSPATNKPKIDLDIKMLAKMSEAELNDAIQSALANSIGTLRASGSYKVVIDPGHGGSDPGAVVNGIYEKNLNLSIALAIRNYLQGVSYPYFDVEMTRDSDIFLELYEINAITNNANADMFISIHNNSFTTDPTVRGTTARYPNNHDVDLSQDLANTMITSITPDPFPKHSDANYQSIQVIREISIPATLVECGFMTNSSDLQILQTDSSDIGYYLGLGINVWCQVNI